MQSPNRCIARTKPTSGGQIAPRFALLAALAAFLFVWSPSSRAAGKAELLSVHRISGAAPHSAFTDLIRFDGEWWCAFREGKGHVSDDGTLRIISSENLVNWFTAAHFQMEGVDLRDPKICLTPRGELLVTTAGAHRARTPMIHQSYSWLSRDGKTWDGPFRIGETNMWLWRVTWHKESAYSIGYGTGTEKIARFYRSGDGEKFEVLVPTLFAEGYPNESGMVFLEDDTAICLLRRDGGSGTAQLGRARPPYTAWEWKDLGVKVGGPQLIQLPDKRLIAGVRLYDGKVRTSIVQLEVEPGRLTELLPLPSGGDTGYPGLVWFQGVLHVSYYSSHEEKTCIYAARVKL